MMKIIRVKTGWEDDEFEKITEAILKKAEKEGYVYYDIKISSKGNNTLLILKKEGESNGNTVGKAETPKG